MDIKVIQHLAKLSRLRFTEEELIDFARDLSSILNYVSELNEVNTEGVEPTGHAVALRNVFRSDEMAKAQEASDAAELVHMAPDQEDGFVKVKAVL